MSVWLVLGFLLGSALLVGVALLVAFLLTMRSLRHRNRISPKQPTAAPIIWLSAPSRPARLHRRLRSAAAVARMIAERSGASRTAELAQEIESEALSIDRHLPVIARLAPRERTQALRQLTAQVNEVERLVSRLSLIDAGDRAPTRLGTDGSAMEELARQLDTLEAARAELRTIDADAGLESHPGLG
jgi:hypothetical protein